MQDAAPLNLVSAGHLHSVHLLHGRDLPCAVDNGRWSFLWPVQAKHRDEFPCQCGEPVGLFFGTGILVLQVEIHRTICICPEVVTRAQRVAVQRVGNKKYSALYIVSDQKPLTGGICPLLKCITYVFDPS